MYTCILIYIYVCMYGAFGDHDGMDYPGRNVWICISVCVYTYI
jgi:hypothetical protein